MVVNLCCRKRRVLMLRALGMRLLTRLLLLVCSLSLVSLLFLSRCGLNVEPEVQLEPGTGKYAHSLYIRATRRTKCLSSGEFGYKCGAGSQAVVISSASDSRYRQHQRVNQFMACSVAIVVDLHILSLVDPLFFRHLECIHDLSWN
jgi:hypothetical protein